MPNNTDNDFYSNYISSNSENNECVDIRSYSTDEDYDVRSSSKSDKKITEIIEEEFVEVGNYSYSNMGVIIKVLAFIVGFGIIIISIAAALLLFASKSGFSVLTVLVIMGGVLFSALLFFPIYGLGHVICQNNEILKLLRKR